MAYWLGAIPGIAPRYLGPTRVADVPGRHTFSRHQSPHRAVGQTLHCQQPSFSGYRFLHLELAPWVHRQRIYSTVISTSSENFPVPTFISGHSFVVNIFSRPFSNDDYFTLKIMIDWLNRGAGLGDQSRQQRFRAANLDKSFTHGVPLSPSSIIWYHAKVDVLCS